MLVMLAFPHYSSNLNAEPTFSVTFKEHPSPVQSAGLFSNIKDDDGVAHGSSL